MRKKLLYLIIIFFGIYGYAQNHIKPAIGYLHVKDILSARIQKKVDELSKCPENKDKNIEVFCCGAKRDVYFKEGGVYLFRLLLSQYLQFPDNINFGESTFTFIIKKNGRIGSIEMIPLNKFLSALLQNPSACQIQSSNHLVQFALLYPA
ncbi:hypothetical protein BAX96_09625 [Elizabethkingia anophelis]|nr:hypothetical protein [Elizabethkingia anophelis]MDV3761785.1 hypothetical protein [Elizabethkingia anophelis]MDV3857492.1 hypothetical protein [Elizabethkingia anophelis]MDV3880282.1 hypothetical protein [Elizabethkingia anophelis]MDV4139952.1 hypothetical protein [Elizabethkingia anophelis]